MHRAEIVDEFRSLNTEEKLALLLTLWDEFGSEAETRPLSKGEQDFLDNRLRRLSEDPRPDRDWADVRHELFEGR